MSIAAPCPDLVPTVARPLSGANASRTRITAILCAAAIGSIAVAIRFWNLGATFESSDQGAMAHMIHHSTGLRWIFAHSYGPTLPLLCRAFSELFGLLGIASSEATCRLPTTIVSLAQVAITFPFLRRLGAATRESLCATICVALLPTLVSDSHYAWGYITIWLFTGTVAVWMTLAWLDERHPLHLAIAGTALCLHCLSNVFAVGVPVTLLAVWTWRLRHNEQSRDHEGAVEARPARFSRALLAPFIGYVLPCLAALAIMLLSWRWTGAGQIGHLMTKHNHGTTFAHLGQLLLAPRLWCEQFGYVFGIIAAAGLIWGCVQLTRPNGRRLGLPALWALIAGFPLTFLTDWAAMHYPGSYLGAYFIEVIFCGGLLGGLFLWRLLERISPRPVPRPAALALAGLVIAVLGAGSADQVLFGGQFTRLSGVNARWGMVRPDTGIKAAGAYVRESVPADCLILCLHNNRGMELPLAEYYTGRHVLSDFDLKPAMYAPVVAAVGHTVDVVIAEAAEQELLAKLPDFEKVCTIRRDAQPVRLIYARRTRGLPRLDAETVVLSQTYDRQCRPTRVPVQPTTPPGFEVAYRTYKATLAELRRAARAAKSVAQARAN